MLFWFHIQSSLMQEHLRQGWWRLQFKIRWVLPPWTSLSIMLSKLFFIYFEFCYFDSHNRVCGRKNVEVFEVKRIVYASMYSKIVLLPLNSICNHIWNIFKYIIIYHICISNAFKYIQIESNLTKYDQIYWKSMDVL